MLEIIILEAILIPLWLFCLKIIWDRDQAYLDDLIRKRKAEWMDVINRAYKNFPYSEFNDKFRDRCDKQILSIGTIMLIDYMRTIQDVIRARDWFASAWYNLLQKFKYTRVPTALDLLRSKNLTTLIRSYTKTEIEEIKQDPDRGYDQSTPLIRDASLYFTNNETHVEGYSYYSYKTTPSTYSKRLSTKLCCRIDELFGSVYKEIYIKPESKAMSAALDILSLTIDARNAICRPGYFHIVLRGITYRISLSSIKLGFDGNAPYTDGVVEDCIRFIATCKTCLWPDYEFDGIELFNSHFSGLMFWKYKFQRHIDLIHEDGPTQDAIIKVFEEHPGYEQAYDYLVQRGKLDTLFEGEDND